MIQLIVTYGCERWTLTKEDEGVSGVKYREAHIESDDECNGPSGSDNYQYTKNPDSWLVAGYNAYSGQAILIEWGTSECPKNNEETGARDQKKGKTSSTVGRDAESFLQVRNCARNVNCWRGQSHRKEGRNYSYICLVFKIESNILLKLPLRVGYIL